MLREQMLSETGQAVTYAGPVVASQQGRMVDRDMWREMGVYAAGRMSICEELITFLGGTP